MEIFRESVQNFLHSQQWTKTEVLTRRVNRNGSRQPEWLFKAFAPAATGDQVFWHYEDSDSQTEFHLTISPEGPRKRKLPMAEWITPPKKKWVDSSYPDKTPTPEVAATVPDSDEEIDQSKNSQEDRSGENQDRDRSPRRNAPAKEEKKKQNKHLLQPDDHFTRYHPSWEICDKGGSGDCAFRAISHCLALSQGKNIEEDKLRTEGAKLRLMAISHLEKHKSDYAEFWSHDPSETNQHRAGLGAATSFGEYLKQAAKQIFWADALLLRGLVSRIGVCLIIFKYNPETKLWVRFALAPKFKHGIATPTSKETKPIVLLLKEGHYRALCPKDPSVEAPGPWFEETPSPDRGVLRGAGGSVTDSVPSLENGILSLPPETPSRTTSDAGTRTDIDSYKRLRITGKQSITLPSATPTRDGNVSSRVDLADNVSLEQNLHNESGASSSTSQPRLEKGHDFHFVWTCPHCGEVLNAATALQRRHMRNNHLMRRHKHNRTDASDKIKEPIPLTPTSPLIPRDQRSWSCPLCHEGLPDLSKHMMQKCAQHHWAERHPGTKRITWNSQYKKRWEQWRNGDEMDPVYKKGALARQQKAVLRFQNNRVADQTDHSTVRFTPHWESLFQMQNIKKKSVLTSQATCVTCTTCRAFQFRPSWAVSYRRSQGKAYSCCPKMIIKRKQRCETWIKLLKNSPETALTLAKIWGVTVQEAGCAFAKTKAQADFDFDSLITTGIEPNPGPCTEASQISIITCNVRSGNGAWSFLDYGASLSNRQLPVLCMQELRMSLGERDAFQRSAKKKDSNVFFKKAKHPVTAGVNLCTLEELAFWLIKGSKPPRVFSCLGKLPKS